MIVNGQNYFNETSFKQACKVLERGEMVELYIDCIGHTRNNNEQEAYKEALKEKYGDRLKVVKMNGAYSYNYMYELEK